jgi:methionyl-tRNA formyltransferase
MQMDDGLDTGNMLTKSTCSIEQDDTSKTLHDKLSLLGAKALIGLLPEVQHQRLTPSAQLTSKATYAQKLTKQEAKINWGLPATDVLRAINGYNPWPVAHTLLNEAPLRIWSAKKTQLPVTQESGHIKSDNNQLFVACQDSYLEITELQPANKRRMTAREYLAAHSVNNLIFT